MRLRPIPLLALMLLIPTVSITPSFADPFMQHGLEPAACVVTDHSEATFHAVYRALVREGARALHAFPPDVVFGHFPRALSESSLDGLPVRIARSPDGALRAELDPITYSIVRDLFDAGTILAGSEVPEDLTFEDMVIDVPFVQTRLSMPPGAARERRVGAPAGIRERNIMQNSEFLIGSVLVNAVFPESVGEDENWTMEEISGAMRGLAIGLEEFQQNTHWVDVDFYYNYKDFIMVPVSVEPVETYWTQHYLWVAELMGQMGYVSDDSLFIDSYAVHKLNNETRERFGTDWVFTVIIADQSNHYNPDAPNPDPGCWGGSGVISYTFYGGPYIMISYPACRLGYGMGFNRVFIHELCHVFWAVDEYPSAGQNCNVTSGYLNYPNRNTLYEQCQEVVPCIMMGVSYGASLPVCPYTMGQIGLADENENSIPDIYEMQPELQFLHTPGINSDTIFSDEYVLGARASCPVRPNENPKQLILAPDAMIDYAPSFAGGTYRLNDMFEEQLAPADGEWDESREDIGVILSGFEPGVNTLKVTVTNCVGVTTGIKKNVYRIGLKYHATVIEALEECMLISWVTAKEVFGATFEIEKEDLTAGGGPGVVGTVTEADEIGATQRRYTFRDEAVSPAHEYRYRITGKFDLEIEGDRKHFEYTTGDMRKTAVIPTGSDFVSRVLPNPTRDHMIFTVDVPKRYYDPTCGHCRKSPELGGATGLRESKSFVDIRIYNVKGELVAILYSLHRFGGLKTVTWDGVDRHGRLVSPGIYFIRVKADDKQAVRKVVILR